MKTQQRATCFLFLKHLDTSGCWCLRFDVNGEIDAPFEKRAPEEIRALQANSITIVIVPTMFTGMHQLNLPWLGERKAREAIPYALEEFIAQPLSELHFAFDKQHYQQGQYLILVADKQQLLHWLQLLSELSIHFDQMTIDWFALYPNEVVVLQDSVLISQTTFKGALSPALAQGYLNHDSEPYQGFLFQNSSAEIRASQCVSLEGEAEVFIAQRLLHTTFINLCQGDLRHDTHQTMRGRWSIVSVVCLGAWLMSILMMNSLNLYRLNYQNHVVDGKIAQIYQEFFPNATDVISPRFRIEQLIKSGSSSQQGEFWYVLGRLSLVVEDSPKKLKIEQLRYHKQSMIIHLMTDDFASLESFENRLRQAQLKVTQVQASSQENHVAAVLELRG